MSITKALAPHVGSLLASSRIRIQNKDWPGAWSQLELAHVVSQPSPWLHTRVHLTMLALAHRVHDLREVFGQLFRLALAWLGSALGRFPAGNSGRARVSPFAPMPIPIEAQRIFSKVGIDGP